VDQADLPLADELAELAVRMSPMLLTVEQVTSAVEVLTALARDTIPGATGAGISLMDDQGHRTSQGATSELVLEADDLQYRLEEGPCLSAWGSRAPVRIDDIDNDPRWPRWSRAVAPLRLLSALSTPLIAGDRVLGAVKVYSEQRSAFDDRAEQLLAGFQSTSALLLANVAPQTGSHPLSDDLRHALRARDAVQIAKGIVMQRDGLSEEAAFRALIAEGGAKRQLREVAERAIQSVARSA
jgi:GAF domain-containing protein